MTPITKQQLQDQIKGRILPDFVIQAFNECIYESKLKNSKVVDQEVVLDRIMKLGNVSRQDVFKEHWLDVEDFYRNAGWTVKYDKPTFNEDYKAYFEFS